MPPLPADSIHARACKLKCEKILTRPVERKSVSELMEEMMEDYQKRHRDKLDEFRELRGETE